MNVVELITVFAIVAAAAFFSGRALYRSFKGQKTTCGCGEDSCPYVSKGKCDQEHPPC